MAALRPCSVIHPRRPTEGKYFRRISAELGKLCFQESGRLTFRNILNVLWFLWIPGCPGSNVFTLSAVQTPRSQAPPSSRGDENGLMNPKFTRETFNEAEQVDKDAKKPGVWLFDVHSSENLVQWHLPVASRGLKVLDKS
jgi:hypothetical protein